MARQSIFSCFLHPHSSMAHFNLGHFSPQSSSLFAFELFWSLLFHQQCKLLIAPETSTAQFLINPCNTQSTMEKVGDGIIRFQRVAPNHVPTFFSLPTFTPKCFFLNCTNSALKKKILFTFLLYVLSMENWNNSWETVLFPGQYGTCRTCGVAAEKLCFWFWDQYDVF